MPRPATHRRPRELTLHQMRVFQRLVEAGSFSRAAAMADVTQSALSRIAAQMETVLGTRLFERSGRGITLTESGHRLQLASTEILRRYDLVRDEIRDLCDVLQGECCVAMPESVGRILFLPLIRTMRERHPHCTIRVMETFSSTIPTMIQSNHADVAIVTDTHAHAGLETSLMAEEAFYLVGRHGEKMVNAPETALRDIEGLPLLLPASSGGIRWVVDQAFAERGLSMNVRLEIDSNEALLDLAGAGDGFAILPFSAVHREVAAGMVSASRIMRPPIRRRLFVALPSGRPSSPIEREVVRTLGALCHELRKQAKWSPAWTEAAS